MSCYECMEASGDRDKSRSAKSGENSHALLSNTYQFGLNCTMVGDITLSKILFSHYLKPVVFFGVTS